MGGAGSTETTNASEAGFVTPWDCGKWETMSFILSEELKTPDIFAFSGISVEVKWRVSLIWR